MTRKSKPKTSHIEAYNEIGELVYFDMPYAAMHYGTGSVSIYQEECIQARVEKLAMLYCAKADKPDSVFSDLEGKQRFVGRLNRKGEWV